MNEIGNNNRIGWGLLHQAIPSFLTHGALGIGSGLVNDFVIDFLNERLDCESTHANDYLCLKTNVLKDLPAAERISSILEKLLVTIDTVSRPIFGIVEYFIPYSLRLNPLDSFSKIAEKLLKIPSDLSIEIDEKSFDAVASCASNCYLATEGSVLSLAFSEELVFRQLIQKSLFHSLAKRLPGRVGQIFSRSEFRILTTSLIFAFSHYKTSDAVIAQFLHGIVFGLMFEKYGLFASTMSHVTVNYLVELKTVDVCNELLSKFELDSAAGMHQYLYIFCTLLLKRF